MYKYNIKGKNRGMYRKKNTFLAFDKNKNTIL